MSIKIIFSLVLTILLFSMVSATTYSDCSIYGNCKTSPFSNVIAGANGSVGPQGPPGANGTNGNALLQFSGELVTLNASVQRGSYCEVDVVI